MRTLLCAILAAFAASMPMLATAADIQAGPYRLKMVTEPAVVPIGKANLRIEVRDAAGKAVPGAKVVTLTGMTGMYMGEREQQAVPSLTEPGVYVSAGQFPMAGAYEIKVSVSSPLGNASASMPIQTGQSTAEAQSSGFPLVPVLAGLGVVVLLAFVAVRMRRTGQRLDARPLFGRQVVGSLLVLGVATAIAFYAVNTWRRKGSMTPIEAQVMDMSAPPPESPAPVTLARAERRMLAPTVRYAGQAVGFVEQEVVPRVSGVIEWMPLYVGDRVEKGQLLVRLDTSQVEPEVAEMNAAVATAQSGVSVATMELQTALAEATEAEAGASTAVGAVEEAKANLTAIEQGKPAALAEVEAAKADVQIALEDIEAATADNAYWTEQLARSKSLLESGYISREKYQRDVAEAAKAEARLHHSEEQARRMRAQVGIAESGVRRAEAEIAAARRRVQQAESQKQAVQARLRAVRSKSATARERIAQAQAGVREAQAGLLGASTTRGYSTIVAEVDGVVTERLIGPGTLVNPGQPILRIAQIQPIRIQANVAEGDLNRIRVGAQVRILLRGEAGKSSLGRVASVSPAIDPNSRTAVVEALLANRDEAFTPGQFVTMEIATAEEQPLVAVPSRAVHLHGAQDAGPNTLPKYYVWLAEPIEGQGSRFSVSKLDVELGAKAGDSVAIRQGLSEGQRVVLQGASSLREGQVVTSDETAGASRTIHTVLVTASGYDPSNLVLAAGRASRITFVRTTASTCAEELVFPALGVRRQLPLNVPVVIDLPAQTKGELAFACGMDMLRGKAVVR